MFRNSEFVFYISDVLKEFRTVGGFRFGNLSILLDLKNVLTHSFRSSNRSKLNSYRTTVMERDDVIKYERIYSS